MLAIPVAITASTVRELNPTLLRCAMRMTNRPEDAHDLVQDTWLSALGSFTSFHGRSSLRTWLLAIMRHRRSDRHRASRNTQEFDEELHAGVCTFSPESADLRSSASAVAHALTNLTADQKRAVTLCDVHEVDRDVAAEQMNMSRSHLRVTLFRAHQKLAGALRERGHEL